MFTKNFVNKMISRETILRLQDLPIEQVAERLGLDVCRHRALCPFHDDTRPSLRFYLRHNTYRCFVCGAHGGPIDLAKEMLHLGFVDACKWLGNAFGIYFDEEQHAARWQNIKPVHVRHVPHPDIIEQGPDIRHLSLLMAQPMLIAEAQSFLYGERRLSSQVVSDLGLSSIACPVPMSGNVNDGWFNAPSLLIPYKDIDGKLLSVQARYLGRENKPRFQFPRGSHCGIFNLPVLKTLQRKEPLFISEGVTDCMALMSAGLQAIAIPSATLLKPEDAKMLQSLDKEKDTTFHMYPDQDAPGERLFLELRDLLPSITRHQLPEGYKDVGQYWAAVRTGKVNKLHG